MIDRVTSRRRVGRTGTARLARALLVVLGLWPCAHASAQALPDLSFADLMKLDAGQVFGASERLQPATEAPSSVSFITADEIKRYGYRTLADILRGVRGIYVTSDRNFSYAGVRGFGKPGDYNSRILLLINGHRVNDNVFGQAEIGAEFGLDPATFERVEIIRGPASSLYGDSAFFAVVNVITRSGASLGSPSVTLEGGTLGTSLARIAGGHRFANSLDVAFSGTVERSDGIDRLYFPEFDTPSSNHGVAEDLDGERARQIYGQLTFRGLAVTAVYGSRRRDIPTASFGTIFNSQDPRAHSTDRHTLLDALYGRVVRGTSLTLRASFDRFSYDGVYPVTGDQGEPLTALQDVLGTRWSLGAGMTRVLPWRQTLRAGVEFIDNVRQNQHFRYVGEPDALLDSNESSTQQAVYLQDEIKIGRRFIFNGGLRYDGYEQFARLTPRAAVIFLPSPGQSLKYLYGAAFRAPNAYELTTAFFGAQVEDLRPESIDTHEVVWERYVADWLRTAVSTYWYKADRLITLVPDAEAFVGSTYINQGQVRAKGLEFEAQMRLRGDARVLASYAAQSAIDQDTGRPLPNSPRHLLKARISLPVPMTRSTVSVEERYRSRRDTLAGIGVAGAATTNLTVLQPLGRAWELFGTVQNLFNQDYRDPVASQHLQDSIAQNGRTARIGLRWSRAPR